MSLPDSPSQEPEPNTDELIEICHSLKKNESIVVQKFLDNTASRLESQQKKIEELEGVADHFKSLYSSLLDTLTERRGKIESLQSRLEICESALEQIKSHVKVPEAWTSYIEAYEDGIVILRLIADALAPDEPKEAEDE